VIKTLGSNIKHSPGDQIGWGLGLSLGLHLLIVAVIIFWPGLGSSSKSQVFKPVYQVKLVGSPNLPPGPVVQAKAEKPLTKPAPKPAPPKLVKKAVAPEPKPAPKPSPKPKEAIGAKKTVKPTKRLKRKKPKTSSQASTRDLDAKINRLKAKVDQERRLASALNNVERKVASRATSQPAGPVGGGGGGGGDQGVPLKYQIYYTQLWGRISRHWVVPEALVANPQGLEAVVVIKIKKDGNLEKAWLEQSSGNNRYDQSCIRAVERAAPYPPLPSGLREKSHEVGIRFKPEDLSG
jgi:TonB family protein